MLGIPSPRVLDFPVRKFPQYRQDILQTLVDTSEESNFDLVFTHWHSDAHQDHQVVDAEAFRALKCTNSTLLSYEVPLDCQAFSPNVFVPLPESEVEGKINAIWSYQSEIARRSYFLRDGLRAAMRYRGPFAHTKFAEAFELKIMVIDGISTDSPTD